MNAKRRWNAAHYTQLNVSLPQDMAAAYKAQCAEQGLSQAGEIALLVATWLGLEAPVAAKPPKPKKAKPAEVNVSDRRHRRAAVERIHDDLESIRDAEQEYRDNMPDNLQSGMRAEAADTAIEQLDTAITALEQAYE
jgi:hypothetical protein